MRFTDKGGIFGLHKNVWAIIALLLVGGWFAYAGGYLDGTPVGDFIDRNKPLGLEPDAELVDLSIFVTHRLDRGTPAATPISVYDENMEYIETASTSTGVATFQSDYWEGETIYLQARATSPNSATYVTYTTPFTAFTVPQGDANGDAQLGTWQIDEVSTSAVYFNVTDQSGAAIYAEATQFVNTTDNQLNLLFTIASDTSYGTPADFTDGDTNKHYLSGMWVVLSCTAAQPSIKTATFEFSTPTLYYYVFRMDALQYDADLGYLGVRTLSIGDGTTAFVASADFDFDVYDMCQANSISEIVVSSFMDGDSDITGVALANKVA